jgi:hypothetical protein
MVARSDSSVFRLRPALIAVLLVLAGCSGAPGDPATTPESDTTTATASTSTFSTANPSATESAEPTSDATPSDATTATTTGTELTTLDAEDLSQSERDLLRQGVENGSVTVTRVNLSDQLTPDTDGWTVRYRGSRYELSWQYEGLRGEYHLDGATEVNTSAVEASDGVVASENLTADARELFDAARSGNETDSYGARAFPDQLRDNRYVTYEGEHYALEIVVGDYVVYRLSVTAVGS